MLQATWRCSAAIVLGLSIVPQRDGAGGAVGELAPPTAGANSPRGLRVLWKVPLASTSFGGGAVADVNGDGIVDVAFSTYFGDSKVRVLSGKDGKEIWAFDASTRPGAADACLDASCRFVDLDGDGGLELVVPISNSSQVLAFDATTGTRRWTYQAGAGECIDTPPWIGTIDGALRVVVGTFKGRLHVIDGRTGAAVRTVQVVGSGAVQSCPVVMDLNGDGHEDLVATSFKGDGQLVAVDGAALGALKEGDTPVPTPKPAELARSLWRMQTGSTMLYHGPSVGDLDGDGSADLVVGTYDGKVYAVKKDGTKLWTTVAIERYIMGPTAIADVDGDGTSEVIVAGDKVTVLRGRDGSVVWSAPVDTARSGAAPVWSVTRGVSVADMDGDGSPDLCALNGRGTFKVMRGRDGAVLYEFDAGSLCQRAVTMNSHLPLVADFDGDGRVDVFFVVGQGNGQKPSESEGVAVCLTGFGGAAKNKDGSLNGWFMHRHDQQNTGNVSTAFPEVLRTRLGAGR